ncbi:BTB/POZ and math domain-containing protein 3 [Phtheirospermum japonicum]|uniref:BTB/POZ and math domain-containing protein 3 n=1 Tax=Phtheirospermum japonicum TaxID=374723 RepID=A0A830CLN5_9LAMI|nr:BTB/POZ and math domain-containing protein 3 [Phtheirospermum japonicum]
MEEEASEPALVIIRRMETGSHDWLRKVNHWVKDYQNVSFLKLGDRYGDESFWGHKWILVASSPVFRSCRLDCNQSQEITIPDIEPRIFKARLRFICTRTLEEEEQNTINHSESVAYMLHLADLYHDTELNAACLRFAAENQEGCEYLKQSCPSLFVELAYQKPSSGEGRELDFHSKIVSAVMEPFVGPFSSLVLQFRNNKLTGKIPTQLHFTKKTQCCCIAVQPGAIPAMLAQVKMLTRLDFEFAI